MMKELKFVCPCCTGTILEERSHGYVFHKLQGIQIDTEMPEDQPEIEWGDNNYDALTVTKYECGQCQTVVSEGADNVDLVRELLKLPCNADVRASIVLDQKECGACGDKMDDSELLHSEDGFDYCRQCVSDGGGRSKFGIVDDRDVGER